MAAGRLRSLLVPSEPLGARRIAVALLAGGLLAASAAAFAVAERLKLERSPLTAPKLDRLIAPECECPGARADLAVRLRRADTIDVSIVDGGGAHVRWLATGIPQAAGVARFTWDGRTDGGSVVRDGRYRLRVHLRESDRTITVPTPIRVDATPPTMRLLEAAPLVISPDGDDRADRVRYVYRADETVTYGVVFVDGTLRAKSRRWPGTEGRVKWYGRVGASRRSTKPGTYSTWLAVLDQAGNRSRPSRRVLVRVRYVELHGVPRRAAAGRAFRVSVDADARQVSLRLVGPGLERVRRVPPGPVTVRAPRRPGRYTLTASVGAHAERSLFRVRRAR
ncbi:MAG: hypothetical protein ICV74_00540 [Thermoleophilia bacterium]|nr:hypothetical protein [Thermoleophilia bacterium]